MTIANLVDYMLNSDLELQIAGNRIDDIADAIARDFPNIVVPNQKIEAAIKVAQQDQYILRFM